MTLAETIANQAIDAWIENCVLCGMHEEDARILLELPFNEAMATYGRWVTARAESEDILQEDKH